MNSHTKATVTLAVRVALLSLACLAAHAQPEDLSMSHSVEALQKLLSMHRGAPPLPELVSTPPAELAKTEHAQDVTEWINKAPTDIPATTYTLYRRFRTAGERPPYESPYFEKRRLLTCHALGAWLGIEGGEGHLVACNDLIWSICEETTWVLPAHEKPEGWNIDLFAAETGVELAHVLLILGDRIPEEIQQRVHAEVKTRILDPYLAHAHNYGWNSGRNNWTGVCAGSVGQTFLLLEPDVERQAQALGAVLDQLDRFVEVAFEEDGASLEGIGYWNYGLIHLVAFAEMLSARTGGAIDLLANDKLKAIAQYPAAVAIGKHVFASFADSHEASSVRPFLAARLAQRTGARALLDQAGEPTDWRFTTVVRNLLWHSGEPGAQPRIENAYLPQSGIIKRTGQTSDRPLVLIAKAGHNAEPHNNNDVASFILRVGDTTYLCDPGGGLYSRDYFGPKRYENIFANSYGHSVPRINGQLQASGPKHAGRIDAVEEATFRIAFQDAYAVPSLNSATRTFTLEKNGEIRMAAAYAFQDGGLDVEEALITWLDVKVDGGTARIISDEGVLEIRASEGAFASERLVDACKANHKKGVLTRITLTSPAQTEIRHAYTMAFQPK